MFEGKNKRKNKALVYLMSIAMVFALFNHGMMMSGEYVSHILEAAEIETAEALRAAVDDDYVEIIKLVKDIELEQTLTIPSGADIAINGNGYYIRWPYADAPAIEIEPGGALTLEDVTIEGQTAADRGNGGISIAREGTLTMGQGSMVRGFADSGVIVIGGRFVLDGGTVAYNGGASSFGLGGGIRIESGEFVMHGGEIRNNGSRLAGGIFAGAPSRLVLHGGEIRNNNAEAGGGLLLGPSADENDVVVIELPNPDAAIVFDNRSLEDSWPVSSIIHPDFLSVGINDLVEHMEEHGYELNDEGGTELAFSWPQGAHMWAVVVEIGDADEFAAHWEAFWEYYEAENGDNEISEEIPDEEDEEIEAEDEEAEPQDVPKAEPQDIDEAEPESEPQDTSAHAPQKSLADLKVTNPQTGDEFSFFGLIISTFAFVVSAFVVFVHREKEKLEETRIKKP